MPHGERSRLDFIQRMRQRKLMNTIRDVYCHDYDGGVLLNPGANWVITDSLRVPIGYNYDNYTVGNREGNYIKVVAMEMRWKMKRVTGSMAAPRIIIGVDKTPPANNVLSDIDILQKSPTKWLELLDEEEIPDFNNNATVLSSYDYRNYYLSRRMTILFNYQKDLNVQASKAEVDSLDQMDSEYVFLTDLHIEVEFQQNNGKMITDNLPWILFMSDQFGATCECQFQIRWYYLR